MLTTEPAHLRETDRQRPATDDHERDETTPKGPLNVRHLMTPREEGTENEESQPRLRTVYANFSKFNSK